MELLHLAITLRLSLCTVGISTKNQVFILSAGEKQIMYQCNAYVLLLQWLISMKHPNACNIQVTLSPNLCSGSSPIWVSKTLHDSKKEVRGSNPVIVKSWVTNIFLCRHHQAIRLCLYLIIHTRFVTLYGPFLIRCKITDSSTISSSPDFSMSVFCKSETWRIVSPFPRLQLG